jgi:hypothetical protein
LDNSEAAVVIAASGSLPAPAISISGGVDVAATPLNASASLPSPTLTISAVISSQGGGNPKFVDQQWLRQQIADAKRYEQRRVPPATEDAPRVYVDRPYGIAPAATGYLRETYIFATPSLDDELAELLQLGLLD